MQPMTVPVMIVGKANASLDQLLSDELDRFNAATAGLAPAEELTERVSDGQRLLAGIPGWTWGQAAGIGVTWVSRRPSGDRVGNGHDESIRGRGAPSPWV